MQELVPPVVTDVESMQYYRMQYNYWIIAIIVILFMIIIYRCLSASSEHMYSGCSVNPSAPNYSFCPGKDSAGNNIGNQISLVNNISGLASYCDSMENCKGFNTDGWFKNNLLPQNKWSTWTNDPKKGLYVKNKSPIPLKKEKFISALKTGIPMINPFSP